MLTDAQITELLKPHVNAGTGPHPHGYCSVAFRSISAEYHAVVTAWVERDGLGHRSFHAAGPGDRPPPPEHRFWPAHSEAFWIIPRARLELT